MGFASALLLDLAPPGLLKDLHREDNQIYKLKDSSGLNKFAFQHLKNKTNLLIWLALGTVGAGFLVAIVELDG